MQQPVIEICGIKKYFRVQTGLFGKKSLVRAVDDVSFSVMPGEIVGLVGESGSGKTTLARLILSLTKPTGGQILVNGVDVAHASRAQERELRRDIAVVFQDPAGNLNPRQSVGQSIMRPMIIHGVRREEAFSRAREALSLVKLDESYMDTYPAQLSGGQQQRIAIARALVLRPKLMILDEPTSALDVSVQAQVLNLLLDLQEQLGLTYLVITHDLNVINYICDRVAVMYLGRLAEYGPAQEVLTAPAHPYTRGLMAASPVLDPHLRHREKSRISGDPGSLINAGPGCRFAPRCPDASDRCREFCPGMTEVSPGHAAACFELEETHK